MYQWPSEPTARPHGPSDRRAASLPFQHRRFVSEAKEREPDVVFIGDSLIYHLQHSETWRRCFAPLHALNFGIGGDQTQHVLWRVTNGEMDSFCPKVGSFRPKVGSGGFCPKVGSLGGEQGRGHLSQGGEQGQAMGKAEGL